MVTRRQQEQHHDHGGIHRQKQGISSFAMQDAQLVFRELKLNKGDNFLDLGCGAGDYAIEAAQIIGSSGAVYALDRWSGVIKNLEIKARTRGLNNIRAIESDILSLLPLNSNIIDVCLMAQVLHGFGKFNNAETLFLEISRILKPGGRVAVLEFKKEKVGFGPPM
jgi:ubiquinone/menaquinone biosynthesis C-methylase UbiE